MYAFHCVAQPLVQDTPDVAVKDADEIKRAAHLDVRKIDVPLLVSGLGLDKTRKFSIFGRVKGSDRDTVFEGAAGDW
ncbi:hypothetical protein Holit_01045 [Hollandina sp. SP2]